jgi:hypothetical protein
MLEKTVKAAVRKRLKEIGAYQHWPVLIGLGESTLDVIGCYKSKFFGIECKRPGGRLTERQKHVIENIQKAGGITFVIDSVEAAGEIFADSIKADKAASGAV